MYQACTGLVLRRLRYSETSLIVSLLTREFGRIEALAKGARKPNGPMNGHLELFSLEEFQIVDRPRASLDLVTETFLQEEFNGLRSNPPGYSAAGLLAELTLRLCMVRDPHPRTLEALCGAYRRLSGHEPAGQVLLETLPELLRDAGLMPRLAGCGRCGGQAVGVLSAEAGGYVCVRCRPEEKSRPPFPEGTRRQLELWTEGSPPPDDRKRLNAKQSGKLVEILLQYMEDVIGTTLTGKRLWIRMNARKDAT